MRLRPAALTLCLLAARAEAQAQPESAGLKIENVEQISDKAKLVRGEETLDRLQTILKAVLKSLGEARDEKDVVKLNCVNEKLIQIKALLRVAQQSDTGLQEAVAKSDEDAAQHEFAKISIAGQRGQQLRAEAEQCVGQLAYVIDERTVVTVETPEDLPDVVTNPTVFTPVSVNPPVLSPTQ